MEIRKIPNGFQSYDFEFVSDDKTLRINFSGNMDLYMVLDNSCVIEEDENVRLDFDITKENYQIYQVFDSLYKETIDGNVFGDLGKGISTDYRDSYEYKELVDDGCNITWVSDEGLIESEDRMIISLVDSDTYRLTFIRNNKSNDWAIKNPFGITIRIRNSGSRYNPFNCIFMRMYHQLQDIDLEYHQIHIEEIEYIKKLSKRM